MYNKYLGIDLKKQREELLKSDVAKSLISEFIEIAEQAANKVYPAFSITDYMLYNKTGDRYTYEEPHRQKRVDCTALAAALWLTGDEKYIKPLTNLIFAICDEFTWGVPAHAKMYEDDSSDIELIIQEIDLYSTRTCTCLCDCLTIAGDKLPEIVIQRVGYEVRRRIIEGFKKHKFRWEAWNNNWIVTCVEGVMFGLVNFGTDEEFKEQLPRIDALLDKYIKGFGDDYCCLEGSGYWSAFREFLRCAVLVSGFTDGKINYFEREDVKEVAQFAQRVLLHESIATGFSDTHTEFRFSPALFSFLNKLYGEDIYLPDISNRNSIKTTMGTGLLDLFWLNPDYKKTKLKPQTTFFKNSQWYVNRGEKYSFAAKGGCNEEVHNHNDVGSFMLTKGNKIIFSELGAGLYTKQAGTLETRYLIINWASWGHSLPIINGEYQHVGEEYCAKNTDAGDNFFESDIEGAYPEGVIKKLHRRFDLEDDGITICDTFEFFDEKKSVVERFLVGEKPEFTDDYVLVGDSKIFYDKTKFNVSLKEDKCVNHSNLNDKVVYFIDFEAKNNSMEEFKLKVIV